MKERFSRKAALHNLGCKVNAYETEAMQQQLQEAGYEIVPFAPGADVYVINTCSVTNIADRKSRQMLHRAKKMNPQAVVVAVGCYVQTAKDKTGLEVNADIVLGNNKKLSLVEALEAYFAGRRDQSRAEAGMEAQADRKQEEEGAEAQTDQDQAAASSNDVIDIGHTKEYEPLFLTRSEEHTRAYVKIQDGCDQFCSYCIIPYARGRARSRDPEEVLRELKALTANGVQEAVLTGIHLSSYGRDTGDGLLDLIMRIHELEGIRRIRLGSLEPGIITETFAGALARMPKFCPHFHLSLQSGCDSVLRRMNRHYSAAEYRQRCELLRDYFTMPALTTDVIVGFPGETEEEFAETVGFLKNLKLYETHIFKYSRRAGTRAAAMPDQVPEAVKSRRSDVLLELNQVNKRAYEDAWAGRECEVLFEEKTCLDGREYYTGYTKEYVKVYMPADGDYENRIFLGTVRRDLSGRMLFERRGNSSAQAEAFTAEAVRTRKFSQEGICPSPQATLNGQIPLQFSSGRSIYC